MSDAEKLTKLKRARGGHRRATRKLMNDVDVELAADRTEVDLERLSQLKRILEEKVNTLKTYDEEIIDLMEDEHEIGDDIEEADDYKSAAYAAIIKAENAATGAPMKRTVSVTPVVTETPSATLSTVETTTASVVGDPSAMIATTSYATASVPSSAPVSLPTGTPASTVSSEPSSVSSALSVAPDTHTSGTTTTSVKSSTVVTPSVGIIPSISSSASAVATKTSVKLPRLTLTPFSGKLTQWYTFWDSFQAAVHNSPIAGVDKFNYLKSHLSGAALESIQGLTLSDANYAEAISIATTEEIWKSVADN